MTVVLEGEVLYPGDWPRPRSALLGPWSWQGEARPVCACGHDLEAHTWRCEQKPCDCTETRPVGLLREQTRHVLVFELEESR